MPDSPLEVLLRSARQHRLPHGLLLNGPHIEDLEEAATELAATLLQGNQPGSSASPFSHPDFYVVRPANKSRQISADTVRDLIRNIHQTSFSNSGKVAVIVEADRMNQSSANIFLKTLEEPPSGTYLLLLTTRPYALLPTIRSRCLFFRFPSTGSRPLPSILQDWLKDFRAFLQQADQPVRGAGDVAPAIMSAYGLNVRFGRLLKEMIQAAKTAENLPQTDDADEIAAYEKRLEVEVRQEIFRQMVEETYRFAEDLGYTEKNFPINPCISTIREIEQASQLLQSNLNVQVALGTCSPSNPPRVGFAPPLIFILRITSYDHTSPYIDAYEKRAYGLFLHYGLYSLLGEGEWVSHHHKLNRADYNKLTARFTAEAFNPREMAAWAKSCGLRYLCLTTRHHDGFSLYDTRGLNTFDAPHSAANRDLVNEFVEACRSQDLGVFFYHTTLDWNEPSFDQDWKSYLAYLRDSVEILCTQYGKIDGLWFDGNWARRDRDWEEDKLYQMIRSHQQDCIIINNSSLSALGAKGHPELDVLTFEQGRPTARTHREGEKYLAAEMCETINGHWGTARHDFSHKSPAELISTFASCRRYRANFLLNIGPLGSGAIPAYEKATLDLVGEWIQLIGPVLYEGLPTTLTTRGEDFVLSHGGEWFYFCHHLPIQDNMHLAHGKPRGDGWQTISGKELPPIERIEWVDCGENLAFTQDHDQGVLAFAATPNKYGHQNIVRVARLVPR